MTDATQHPARDRDAARETGLPGADAVLDVSGETCPMTFVRTRLALDRLPPGGRLRVRLRGDEPLRNVSSSAAALGHAVRTDATNADGTTTLLITRR